MTATSAVGDPLPPFPIGVSYAPTSEEDEAWVLQAPCPRINKKSHSTWYGTHRTVATPVEKFPCRPHDNRRRHDNHRNKPNRSAAAAIAIAPTPTTPLPSPSTSHPVEVAEAVDRAFKTLRDELRADLYSLLQSMPKTSKPVLTSNQPTSLPTHPKQRPPTPITGQRRKPVERTQQARRNRNKSAQLFPAPTLQPLPPTPTSPSFSPTQPEPPSPLPTSSSTSTEPTNNVLDNPNVSTMTDLPDQPFLTAPTLPSTTMKQQPTPPQPSPPNLLPLSLTSLPATPPPATPTPLIHLSLMERLTHNNSPVHATLWIPDALNRQHALNRTMATQRLTGHHPHPATDTLPLQLAAPHSMINLSDDRHGTVRTLATIPPPAPDPPDSSNQPCHALHLPMAKPASTVPFPWLIPSQRCHQHSPQLIYAVTYKAFAHNRRPP